MSLKLLKVLQDYKKDKSVSLNLIEQDYALGWVLFGIANTLELKQSLIFKGGTCLRKCFFGDYRFSQDLDFSTVSGSPAGKDLEELIKQACNFVANAQKNHGIFMQYHISRYLEKLPHPKQQEAFKIKAQFPWQTQTLTTIMIEVTNSEIIALPPESRQIIHPYENFFEAFILTYPLEEIVAEKIAAILQFAKKLHERGWGRSRARDYYDLWSIFNTYKNNLNYVIIPEIVNQKCIHRGVVFEKVEDIFTDQLMENLKISWQQWVRPLVNNLPELEEVIRKIKAEMYLIFVVT